MTSGSQKPDDDDWRLKIARHLEELTLRHRVYTRWSDTWDHDHCAVCMVKFAEIDDPDIRRVGYATGDDYKLGAGCDWVCERCFAGLKEKMDWTSVDDR